MPSEILPIKTKVVLTRLNKPEISGARFKVSSIYGTEQNPKVGAILTNEQVETLTQNKNIIISRVEAEKSTIIR